MSYRGPDNRRAPIGRVVSEVYAQRIAADGKPVMRTLSGQPVAIEGTGVDPLITVSSLADAIGAGFDKVVNALTGGGRRGNQS